MKWRTQIEIEDIYSKLAGFRDNYFSNNDEWRDVCKNIKSGFYIRAIFSDLWFADSELYKTRGKSKKAHQLKEWANKTLKLYNTIQKFYGVIEYSDDDTIPITRDNEKREIRLITKLGGKT